MKAFTLKYVLKKKIELIYGPRRCNYSLERIFIELKLACPGITSVEFIRYSLKFLKKFWLMLFEKKGHSK